MRFVAAIIALVLFTLCALDVPRFGMSLINELGGGGFFTVLAIVLPDTFTWPGPRA